MSDAHDVFANLSYAQEGEDRILARLFEFQSDGFYVDIGAHHPARFSNTKLLYDRGWRGVNVDPTPGTKALFDQARPGDVNLEIAVGREGECRTLTCFNEGALNTLSESLADQRAGMRGGLWQVTERRTVELVSLAALFERHAPASGTINLLDVDTESWDLEVLRSNDWERFAPDVVLTETHVESIERVLEHDIHVFLAARGYHLLAKTFRTLVYRRDRTK